MSRIEILFVISLFIVITVVIYTRLTPNQSAHTISSCKPAIKIPYMSIWNSNKQLNQNAVAILFNDQVQELQPTISALDKYFDDNSSSDIIIFHTGYPLKKHLQAIARITTRKVIFYNIDEVFMSFPEGFNPYLEDPNWMKRGKWNYQHMCRFWFKLIMDIPLVNQYQYLMRLDDDSKITGVWYNVFEFMKKRKAFYFANIEQADSESGLPGLMELKKVTHLYNSKYNIEPKNPERLQRAFNIPGHIRLYNTNFDIIHVQSFNRPEVRHWVDAVDKTFGIFKYRWGDHVLRYITTALFLSPNEVLVRTDFNLSYCHPC